MEYFIKVILFVISIVLVRGKSSDENDLQIDCDFIPYNYSHYMAEIVQRFPNSMFMKCEIQKKLPFCLTVKEWTQYDHNLRIETNENIQYHQQVHEVHHQSQLMDKNIVEIIEKTVKMSTEKIKSELIMTMQEVLRETLEKYTIRQEEEITSLSVSITDILEQVSQLTESTYNIKENLLEHFSNLSNTVDNISKESLKQSQLCLINFQNNLTETITKNIDMRTTTQPSQKDSDVFERNRPDQQSHETTTVTEVITQQALTTSTMIPVTSAPVVKKPYPYALPPYLKNVAITNVRFNERLGVWNNDVYTTTIPQCKNWDYNCGRWNINLSVNGDTVELLHINYNQSIYSHNQRAVIGPDNNENFEAQQWIIEPVPRTTNYKIRNFKNNEYLSIKVGYKDKGYPKWRFVLTESNGGVCNGCVWKISL